MKIFSPQLLAALLFTLPLASQAENDTEEKVVDKDWVTITAPVSAGSGEEVTAKIKIKGEAIKESLELHTDLHLFVGEERKPQGKHAPTVKVAPGEDVETTVTFTGREGMTHMSFVVFLLPSGETLYEKKTHMAELSLRLEPN